MGKYHDPFYKINEWKKQNGCPRSFLSFWNSLGWPCCDAPVSSDDVHYSQTPGDLCPNDLVIIFG